MNCPLISFMIRVIKNLIPEILHKVSRIPPHSVRLPSTFIPLTIGMLLTLNLSLLTFDSCGLDIEDPTPPATPKWIQKSLPEEWPERGIDAHESGGIYLEWSVAPEEEIVSFVLFRAIRFNEIDSIGEYENRDSIAVISSRSTFEYLDVEVLLRTRYYYIIRSEDIAGNYSEYSDTISYSILPIIESASMNPNGLESTLPLDRTLRWQMSYTSMLENYCLTILTSTNELVFRSIIAPKDYTGGLEWLEIPARITLEGNSNYKWRVDTGANYQDGYEHSGSESVWAIFAVEEP
jgi:hypothetical protein